MLDELFLATDAFLSGGSSSVPERLRLLRTEVKKYWPEREDFAFVDEYLGSMPERYLLSNAAHEIAAHAVVALQSRGNVVKAAIVPSRLEDVTELCVVTGEDVSEGPWFRVRGDRPGLLAAIAAAIAGNNLEVHAAQIYTRKLPKGGEQAVDLFWVTRRLDEDDGAAVVAKLQQDLESVIRGSVVPSDLVKKRGSSRWSDRPSPPVPTEVVVDNRASARHTLIEVVARDRPGLLFTVSQAFHEIGVTIAIAKINTEGTRAIDVFYVTELDGRKVESETRTSGVRRHLLAALGASTRAPGSSQRPSWSVTQ
jgi:[protein-PII] uridylyltransferase